MERRARDIMDRQHDLANRVNFFPFSANRRKEVNNRISDFDINFSSAKKEASPELLGKITETADQLNVKDPAKRANWITMKARLFGQEVHQQAIDRVLQAEEN